MVVHPAAGHYTGTLVNGLMHHCREELSGINGVMRPGIVHRIDMDTTGVLIVCKNDKAHNAIAEQLKVHSITRKYYAIVHGVIKEDDGTVNAADRTPSGGPQEDEHQREEWQGGCHPLSCPEALSPLYLCGMPVGDRADSSDPCSYGEHRSSASGRSGLRTCKGSVFRSSGSDTACRSPWHHPSVYRRIYGISRAASGIF